MIVAGLESIPDSVNQPPKFAKFILNETAIVFFRFSTQHQDVKLHGLSYEDHRGNAVAGSFANDRVDIRFHKDFSDERIRGIWMQVCSEPTLSFLHGFELYYQGRRIT
jgi:hypothetical protein